MLLVQFMALAALGALRRARKERLPWGASSGHLYAAMLWVVCLTVIVAAALFLYYVGVGIGKEIADTLHQTSD